ncbi:FAD/NAD(P)-binding domain-containing protein [Aspergillus japonicus CBS 114.51]|uniref:FAD/NAD(P)-binding domain-containing protein n=1 Tax=Aspergillus japonicus CBS 114.51 TaxID=1448312 RepID=A0A8T8XEU7_ASPJA|nr:FAD/NAD(P)-binding domain-containing protein [Aspergillus japonicus CBS 114.51]RAH85859.1 FAD/NAD(P)-binding domain-containing protein [Aspergillus japonicus CBS 114.51]
MEQQPQSASIRAKWAQSTLIRHLEREIADLDLPCDESDWAWVIPDPSLCPNGDNSCRRLPRPPPTRQPATTADPEPLRICIIGAGITGLYLAMMLDSLQLPHLCYEILEASARVGGRVYTHRFGPGRAEYYDIGAMRFPKIPPLRSAFDLFARCRTVLLPYDYQGQRCPAMFNGVWLLPGEQAGSDPADDPFRLSVSEGGVVPDKTVAEGAPSILNRAFAPFIAALSEDFPKGFEELMKYDHMTTREFLQDILGLDFYSIWYMETVGSAAGLYDQSFTEAVLDAMDFDYPFENAESVDWYRVDGGTDRVIEHMHERASVKPSLNARVTAINYNPHARRHPMAVQVGDESQPRHYSAVFNTTSLPCLRRMALGPRVLRPGQQAAVSAVHYDASTKVAIKFRTAWWTQHCQILGGQASTDLPLRTCVYPSTEPNPEGTKSGEGQCTVLLCSYTWGQDAQQMASLLHPDTSTATGVADFLCHNLALLHHNYIDPATGFSYGYPRMLDIIRQAYEGYHGYDWYANPHTAGAFAYFGPGQFRHFYPELVRPAAGGRMFLVGEACSAHHGWIAGALDSAYRGLVQFLQGLVAEGRVPADALRRVRETWGAAGEGEEIPEEIIAWQVFLAQMTAG